MLHKALRRVGWSFAWPSSLGDIAARQKFGARLCALGAERRAESNPVSGRFRGPALVHSHLFGAGGVAQLFLGRRGIGLPVGAAVPGLLSMGRRYSEASGGAVAALALAMSGSLASSALTIALSTWVPATVALRYGVDGWFRRAAACLASGVGRFEKQPSFLLWRLRQS